MSKIKVNEIEKASGSGITVPTGSTFTITDGLAQASIADQAINEAKLQISNAPTNGYFLSAQSGNTGGLTWAEAGGGGKIGQVLQTVKTSTFSHTFGSSHSFTNITGLSQAITPVATSSKVLVMVTVHPMSDDGSQAVIDTIRDTTQIFVGDSASSKISATSMAWGNAGLADWTITNVCYNFLDSPNTTSATTYQVRLGGWSATHHVNKSERDHAGTSYDNRLASSITLMEILA